MANDGVPHKYLFEVPQLTYVSADEMQVAGWVVVD